MRFARRLQRIQSWNILRPNSTLRLLTLEGFGLRAYRGPKAVCNTSRCLQNILLRWVHGNPLLLCIPFRSHYRAFASCLALFSGAWSFTQPPKFQAIGNSRSNLVLRGERIKQGMSSSAKDNSAQAAELICLDLWLEIITSPPKKLYSLLLSDARNYRRASRS